MLVLTLPADKNARKLYFNKNPIKFSVYFKIWQQDKFTIRLFCTLRRIYWSELLTGDGEGDLLPVSWALDSWILICSTK